MSYVTIEDFQVRYENSVPYGDNTRLQALLDDACDMAADIIDTEYADGVDVPGGVIACVCAAVRRAYENPTGIQGETIGDYSWRAASVGSGGVYFTEDEKRILRRAVGKSSGGYIELEGHLPATVSTAQYVDTTDGESVLYYAVEDVPV